MVGFVSKCIETPEEKIERFGDQVDAAIERKRYFLATRLLEQLQDMASRVRVFGPRTPTAPF